ncbi:MAG: glycosyltransferase family 2 protein [Limisphaerales bacterium]
MNEPIPPFGVTGALDLPVALAWISLALAVIPFALFIANLPFYRRIRIPSKANSPLSSADIARRRTSLSVLIPARNEEHSIDDSLESVLADPRPDLEVIVLDDHSTDATTDRVRLIASRDPRVRLIAGAPLPAGWCGKQHACWQLAQASRGEHLVFLDADVRLEPEGLNLIDAYLEAHPEVHLASGVPAQITGTFLEKLLIPLIHLVLLGYLPMVASRFSLRPAFAAGCGQLFAARRIAYFASGGHQSIRSSLHDGVQLPRSFRRHGFQTGLFDATPIARCRMYSSAAEVWRGLGKNATEGMAHPAAIVPWSILLLGGHVLPWVLLPLTVTPLIQSEAIGVVANLAGAAAALGLVIRSAAALRFRQSPVGALLHPVGVALLIVIQWEALFRRWRGRPMAWRGRQYPHPNPTTVPVDSHHPA